jgi:hypothetical protein
VLLDTLIEPTAVLLATDPAALALDERHRTFVASLGGRTVLIGEGGGEDVDGVYAKWLSEHDADAVLLRPDSYVFGVASGASGVADVIEQLALALKAEGGVWAPVVTVG